MACSLMLSMATATTPIAVIAMVVWFLASNTLHNMRVRGIQSGFDFLRQQAGFTIGESLFPFDSSESYLKGFAVGLSNTLRVALAGIVLATFIGTVVGVGRFSRNLLVRSLCAAYVECFRNIPVLIQLLIWYLVFTEILPPLNEAPSVAGMFYLLTFLASIPALFLLGPVAILAYFLTALIANNA